MSAYVIFAHCDRKKARRGERSEREEGVLGRGAGGNEARQGKESKGRNHI